MEVVEKHDYQWQNISKLATWNEYKKESLSTPANVITCTLMMAERNARLTYLCILMQKCNIKQYMINIYYQYNIKKCNV